MKYSDYKNALEWGAESFSAPGATSTTSTPVEDQRIIPLSYRSGQELSTGCKVNGVWKDPVSGNKKCRYGDKSSGGEHCMYWKYGAMCDKVVIDDKEYN